MLLYFLQIHSHAYIKFHIAIIGKNQIFFLGIISWFKYYHEFKLLQQVLPIVTGSLFQCENARPKQIEYLLNYIFKMLKI